jgi:hypothetical protein
MDAIRRIKDLNIDIALRMHAPRLRLTERMRHRFSFKKKRDGWSTIPQEASETIWHLVAETSRQAAALVPLWISPKPPVES